jgi:hypothetical protein
MSTRIISSIDLNADSVEVTVSCPARLLHTARPQRISCHAILLASGPARLDILTVCFTHGFQLT